MRASGPLVNSQPFQCQEAEAIRQAMIRTVAFRIAPLKNHLQVFGVDS